MGLIAGILTLSWFLAIGWYLSIPIDVKGVQLSWFSKIASLEPNHFGDFMAGAFAPLAFFWLAYSVWIQKTELVETREVLKKQEVAQNNSARSAKKLSELTAIQIQNSNQLNRISTYDTTSRRFDELNKAIRHISFTNNIRSQGVDLVTQFPGGGTESQSKFLISERLIKISYDDLFKEYYNSDANITFSTYISSTKMIIDELRKICENKNSVLYGLFKAEGYEELGKTADLIVEKARLN
jgi:hypothetical protein